MAVGLAKRPGVPCWQVGTKARCFPYPVPQSGVTIAVSAPESEVAMNPVRALTLAFCAALLSACGRMQPPATPAVPNDAAAAQSAMMVNDALPQLAPALSTPIGVSTTGRVGVAHVFDQGITEAEIAADKNRYNVEWGTAIPAVWRAADPAAWVSRYYILNEDNVGISGRGLPYWQQFRGRPDLIPGSWILYACTPGGVGTRQIAYTPGTGSTVAPSGLADVPLDIHNPYVRDYQILSLVNYAIAHHYNAIGVDEVLLFNVLRGGNPHFGQQVITGYYGCGIWQGNTFVRHYASPIDPVWAADVIAWIARAHQLLTTTFATSHIALIVNHPAAALSASEESLLVNVNIALNETGYSSYGTYNQPYQAGLFRTTQAWTRWAQLHGVRIVTIDKFAFTPSISTAQRDLSLATYFMGNFGAEDLVVTGAHYTTQPYYAEFATVMGAACGEMYRDVSSTNIYLRRFANGIAVVNAGFTPQTAHLPAHVYHDVLGRTFVNPVPASDANMMSTTIGTGCR